MIPGNPYSEEYPAGIWCQNDVVSTSMRRDHVASTLIRRHFYVICPLGKDPEQFCTEKLIWKVFFYAKRPSKFCFVSQTGFLKINISNT